MSIELLDLSPSGIDFHSFGAATTNALSVCFQSSFWSRQKVLRGRS